MNTTKSLQQVKLDQWAVLCKEQSQSSLTIKQWCEQNGYTIHTYNYWSMCWPNWQHTRMILAEISWLLFLHGPKPPRKNAAARKKSPPQKINLTVKGQIYRNHQKLRFLLFYGPHVWVLTEPSYQWFVATHPLLLFH